MVRWNFAAFTKRCWNLSIFANVHRWR